MATVLYGTVEPADAHDTGYGHPERHERLVAVSSGVAAHGLTEALTLIAPRLATDAELHLVHDTAYVSALTEFAAAGGGHLDADTPVARGSAETARLAAGLGLAAIDAVDAGAARAAFVAPRPPGHHAFGGRGSGFCLFNNVAIAAAALAERGERVAIYDWDVHHGNGTQAVFWNDPRVLYASTHQYPFYPGTGAGDERGGPDAEGVTVNAPLRAGTDGSAAREAFDEVVGPAIDAFDPTWILVSAGYDAHRADPLAELRWDVDDFAWLTTRITAFGRPIVAFLEGGYDLSALAASSAATIAALLEA